MPEVEQNDLHALLEEIAKGAPTRFDFWAHFLNATNCERAVEIGVWTGDFAARMLLACPKIREYVMIDPWRHLEDWNKPLNRDQEVLESVYQEALRRTAFAETKRKVLRGKTTEVIGQLPDLEYDFIYVDGDHTLRGITIDLIRAYPKVRVGGYLCGDDFSRSIWVHGKAFEPTMVCPFAAYFAEAVGEPFYALPMDQFLIHKTREDDSRFFDLAGTYGNLSILGLS